MASAMAMAGQLISAQGASFGALSGSLFLGMAMFFYRLYGWTFLHETYLYHATRMGVLACVPALDAVMFSHPSADNDIKASACSPHPLLPPPPQIHATTSRPTSFRRTCRRLTAHLGR